MIAWYVALSAGKVDGTQKTANFDGIKPMVLIAEWLAVRFVAAAVMVVEPGLYVVVSVERA
jgi:hypothetical protein